jgi:hypothetical protein
MVKKVFHEDLKEIIKTYYKNKLSLLVYGTFGIGKSYIIKEVAKEIAKSKTKIYVEWNSLSYEEKKTITENPEGYFVLMDIRLSEMDYSDIRGLPDFKENNIVWKSPFWTKILENPNSDGFLFFDELNLSLPIVMSSCYKIIYDRIINEGVISPNWLILGAGNLSDDRAYTHEIPMPLRDRVGEVILEIPSHEGFIEWAIANNIDSRIISFINFSPNHLRQVDFEDTAKQTTPRGYERLSTLIKGVDDYKQLRLIVGTAIGEGVAEKFLAFCSIEGINLNAIIENPEEFKKVQTINPENRIGTIHFIVGSLAEQYGRTDKISFKKLLQISDVLDSLGYVEFITLMWRFCAKYNLNKFRKDYTQKENDNPLKKKYNKYLVG